MHTHTRKFDARMHAHAHARALERCIKFVLSEFARAIGFGNVLHSNFAVMMRSFVQDARNTGLPQPVDAAMSATEALEHKYNALLHVLAGQRAQDQNEFAELRNAFEELRQTLQGQKEQHQRVVAQLYDTLKDK